MAEHNLNSLDPAKFLELVGSREGAIEKAPAELKSVDLPANTLAKRFHPRRQYLKVSRIVRRGDRCNSYILSPDKDRGTEELAYFAAGQYVSVFVNIDGKKHQRPYSLSSSPKSSLDGSYEITVKGVSEGLVSSYILDNWTVGCEVETSAPMGSFTYEPLRDASHVICIAGGSGITPFVSLANAVADGDEECSLTLLYGCRTEADILFKDELCKLSERCDKIKVVYVLSHEEKDGYESGFITKELIEKYAGAGRYSLFLCGPRAMYSFADGEIEKLSVERKYIRHEVHGESYGPEELSDYPGNVPETVSIKVKIKDECTALKGSSRDTVLRILEKNGIASPSRCRSGECGFCRSRLVSGEVYMLKERNGLRLADSTYGYIHPCCTYPLGDIEIEVFPEE